MLKRTANIIDTVCRGTLSPLWRRKSTEDGNEKKKKKKKTGKHAQERHRLWARNLLERVSRHNLDKSLILGPGSFSLRGEKVSGRREEHPRRLAELCTTSQQSTTRCNLYLNALSISIIGKKLSFPLIPSSLHYHTYSDKTSVCNRHRAGAKILREFVVIYRGEIQIAIR